MNRYISGRRTYERYDITLSFVAKRKFADGAEESLTVKAKDEDTLIPSAATLSATCAKRAGASTPPAA